VNPAVDGQNGPKNGATLLGLIGILLLGWRFWVLPQLGITLYVDEAQYWTWAQEPAWGYFSKPPGIAALIWLSTALFGDGLLGVKALAMLCYPAAAAACWAIARRLYDERTAFWSALSVLTLPMFSWLGLFVSTDALLTLFWTLALWAFLRARAQDGWGDWLLLGLFCGLGLLSKYTMAAWLGAAFLYLLAFERARLKSAKPWVAALLALLILAPNIAWNVAHDFPTLKHTADITVNKHAAGGLGPLAEFWAAQWISFGPVLGSVFVLLLARSRQTWRDERARLLLWFALPLWAVVSAQALKSGANANWAAPAFAPAAIAAVAWLLTRECRRWLLAALALNTLLVGVVYHWPMLMAAVNPENPAKKDFYTRARGWDELGRQMRPFLIAHPEAVLLADGRTLLAHLRYELRDLHPVAVAWNPKHEASDHYKLTTDLNAHRGSDALLVTEGAPDTSVRQYFVRTEKLGELTAPLDGRTSRHVEVYLLHDFQGY
jgi:4-amino-4-deoxy-L-arabinose transferase-like glycosyltransferase